MCRKKETITDKLNRSPINYYSDLFIVAMVLMWIIDNIYESVIATIVTISSVILSHELGTSCYDTSMWSSIGTNVAVPLSCGGGVWMIKNSIQHAISYYRGKEAVKDFPAVHPDGEDEELEIEKEMTIDKGKEEETND